MSDIDNISEEENKKWIVVHFIEEQSVEVVPKKWYITSISKSYWPGKDVRASEAIKKCFTPRPNWLTYSVHVLGEYDNFDEASRKVVKAKTSDVLSSDYGVTRKRKPVRKLYGSSSSNDESSGDDTIYPRPPTKIKKTITHKNSNRMHQGNSNTFLETISLNKTSTSTTTPTTRSDHLTAPSADYSWNATSSKSTETDSVFQRQVLRLLHTINGRLDALQTDVNLLLHNKTLPIQTSKDDSVMDIINDMPFLKRDQLENVEQLNNTQLEILGKELSMLGGDSVKEITRTLMYRVFSNQLGCLYTWEGMKNKEAFKTLKIAQVLIMAVRLNPKTLNASESDIIKIIKGWLLRAKERLNNNNKKQDLDGRENE